MYEYIVYCAATGEEMTVFGYTGTDAFRRSGLDPNEWRIVYSAYID